VTTLAADGAALLAACLTSPRSRRQARRRADRLAAFRWHRAAPPTLHGLIAELPAGRPSVRAGHATGDAEVAEIAGIARTVDADLLVAGGVSDLAGVRRVRDAGAAGIILGEALLSGAMNYQTAREAAA
jgi:hypothetical protein